MGVAVQLSYEECRMMGVRMQGTIEYLSISGTRDAGRIIEECSAELVHRGAHTRSVLDAAASL